MNSFFSLFKISLNLNFSISSLKYRFTKEKKSLVEPIFVGVSIAFGIGALIFFICFLSLLMFTSFKAAGQPEALLTLSMVACQLMILIFGIFYIMGAFYFSKDINILIPLPLKPVVVLGNKFLMVMINEYLTAIPVLLPSLIIYGFGTDQSLLYWLKALIILAFAPLIPLTISAAFVLLLMRFVNIQKSKDLFAIIGGILGLLIAIGSNYLSQRMNNSDQSKLVEKIINSKNGLTTMIGQKFPPSVWATHGLSQQGMSGIGYTLLFILISLAMLAILILIGNFVFYKGLLSGEEVNRKRKKLSAAELDIQSSKSATPIFALFLKEWRMFLRTPIYVLNGIAGMVIGPFLVLMPILTNKQSGDSLMPFIKDPNNGFFVALGSMALMIFAANINIIASTSVSREGKMFWISKAIPVSPKDQIIAKALHSIVLETLGILVTSVVLAVFIKIQFSRLVAVILISALASVLSVILSLMIDVLKPKLEWSSPQEAVKRNINGVLGMLVTFLMIIVLGIITAIMMVLHLPEIVIYLLLCIIIFAIIIPSAIGLFTIAEERYRNIEA